MNPYKVPYEVPYEEGPYRVPHEVPHDVPYGICIVFTHVVLDPMVHRLSPSVNKSPLMVFGMPQSKETPPALRISYGRKRRSWSLVGRLRLNRV